MPTSGSKAKATSPKRKWCGIRAQLYSFQAEYLGLINQIMGLESELRLTVQIKPTVYIQPVADSASLSQLDPGKYPLTAMLDSAYRNRTDLLIARTNTDINKLQYSYQRALAVPDLTLSLEYDKQGSYAQNFQALGASIDLPAFNRNQGNIKSARYAIDNTVALQRSAEANVSETITNALEIAYTQNSLYKTLDPRFPADFERLANAELQAYEKRTIGLLEFLDFYDAFKQNVVQLNAVQYNRVQAFEDLNYYTATSLFNQ